MSKLMGCGVCCMLISGWGIVQLVLMGILFYMEAPHYLHECEAEEYDDYDDFIAKTKENYRSVAFNCWIAAAMYIATLLLSCVCIKKAQRTAAKEAKLQEDDEYFCDPTRPQTT